MNTPGREKDGGVTDCSYSLQGISKSLLQTYLEIHKQKKENSLSQRHHIPKYVDTEKSLRKLYLL